MLKKRQIPHCQNRRSLILLILAATLLLVPILSATACALLATRPPAGQKVTRKGSPILPAPAFVKAKVRLTVPHNLRTDSRVTVSGTVTISHLALGAAQAPSPSKQIISVQRDEHNHWRPLHHVRLHRGHFEASIALNHTGTLVLRATIITRSGTVVHGTSSVAVRHVAQQPLHTVLASYYTDYGLPTGCGGILGANELGVANKILPCGTMVLLVYHGRHMTVPVIDRGPYSGQRVYDLTGATAAAIGFDESKGVDSIQTNVNAG